MFGRTQVASDAINIKQVSASNLHLIRIKCRHKISAALSLRPVRCGGRRRDIGSKGSQESANIEGVTRDEDDAVPLQLVPQPRDVGLQEGEDEGSDREGGHHLRRVIYRYCMLY